VATPESTSVEELLAVIAALQARVTELEAEVARLRGGPGSGGSGNVPSFVKPNRPPRVKKERKRRAQSQGRRREPPTRTVEHAVEHCPDCGRRLEGGWLHRVRQVIEIPQTRYEVVEHRMLRRHCGVCGKDHAARPDLSEQVVGQHRVGIRLMSLVVTLKKACRMTVRGIQRLLRSVYGLHLSIGQIVELLHFAARAGRPLYEELLTGIRQSPCVQADETSWREAGQNHWLWSFSTPKTRVYVEDKSRGHQVPEQVLGEQWRGVLVSDFYGGYSFYLGEHQRCWVHFLRDLKALGEKHPDDAALGKWTKKVRALLEAARRFHSDDRRKRVRARERFQERLVALGEPYVGTDVPQRILAERIMRFSNELFAFVEHTEVPADNNAAERAIRPAVVYRKVTGGSRSATGSSTTAVLFSLVGTWMLRGDDPFAACCQMLRSTHRPLPSHQF
jgi:transposase